MDEEMEDLDKNAALDLVDLPTGKKSHWKKMGI